MLLNGSRILLRGKGRFGGTRRCARGEGVARRDAVDRVVNAAKARIANQLALRLNKSLSQTLSKDDYWFDPYVGLRGRYNFNKTYYTAVRGEIGGFGVGADLMWEVEGVIGINLTRSIFTEIGYRALGGNFEDRDFRFDVVMHGPQITTGNYLLKAFVRTYYQHPTL